MTFAIGAVVPWTVPPDWTRGVRERLAWMTNVLTGSLGTPHKRRLRDVPWRSFSFEVLAAGPDRALLDAQRYDMGGRLWALPIWQDAQPVAGVVEGAGTIACRTAGFDFAPGAQALLMRDARSWELVTVDAVLAGGISLQGTTAAAWARGTRLLPVRQARLVGAPQERLRSDRVARVEVEFEVDEPSTWSPAAWPVTYRGLPVFDARTDEGSDPTSEFVRPLDRIEGDGTGPVDVTDIGGFSSRLQDFRWLLQGRAAQTALRARLYALAGRYATVWLPSGADDLAPAGSLGGPVLSVRWAGVTVFGRQQPNRRDLRIELYGGDVLHRRVLQATEDGDRELLTLDAPLPVALPAQVRRISWMSAAQLASDVVELERSADADGVLRAAVRFESVRHDG